MVSIRGRGWARSFIPGDYRAAVRGWPGYRITRDSNGKGPFWAPSGWWQNSRPQFYHWLLVRNHSQLFTASPGFLPPNAPHGQSAWQQPAWSRPVGACLSPVLKDRVLYNESETWERRLLCEVTSPSHHTFCSAGETPGCTPAHRWSLQKGRTHLGLPRLYLPQAWQALLSSPG